MNVRQRKKAFKKKHGYNPVNMQKKKVRMAKQFVSALTTYVDAIKNMLKKLPQILTDTVKRIQEMPEEEFQEKLSNLSFEEKQLAIKIRERRQL